MNLSVNKKGICEKMLAYFILNDLYKFIIRTMSDRALWLMVCNSLLTVDSSLSV